MKFKPTPIAAAVALACMGVASAYAQQADNKDKTEKVEKIEVTGIRGSLEKSIESKRNADSVVEVITAEDIGKMPDKNIADSLQRVPGVTTSSQSGGSGGFDENDRVSLRGTNPSLTQTLINGHTVASSDWFILDQVGLVGRSVSYTMLPSELVSQVFVRKSATADLVEGGVAGAVDIITRKALDFRKPLTVEAYVGGVYAELPKKTDPQFNALLNWKNEANNFGILVQGFYEKRHLRRDGQEILGYGTISPTSALATARPDLAGVAFPTLIGSALFEQERERKGGFVDVQFKPMRDLTVDLSGFSSKLEATNYNRNWMMFGNAIINANRIPSFYRVENGTLTAATWNNVGSPGNNAQYAVVDEIYRPGAFSETNFWDLDVKWRMNDRTTFTGKVGKSEGKGETPVQQVFEGDVFNSGASYSFNGLRSAADVSFPSGNPSSFVGTSLDWIFGASPGKTKDDEKYAQFDGDYDLGTGMFTGIKFGYRWAEHERSTTQVAQGPNFAADPFNPANLPRWGGETYPGDFGSGLGGNFPRQPWQINPDELTRWGNIYSNRDPVVRQFWPGEFALNEKIQSLYAMTNFEGQGYAGNVGLRYVKTDESVLVNQGVDSSICAPLAPCPQVPGAITTSAFGTFYRRTVDNTYKDWLPSANLKFDLDKNTVLRFAAAKTMARPDYSALGGAITADDTTLTGNGGNPDLKPIRSFNADVSLEYYYAPRALLSAGAFYMDLTNYVAFGTYQTQLFNIRNGTFQTYTISAPINSSGKVKGAELSWQSPLPWGFGGFANYTYSHAEEDNGAPLVGASKNTGNIGGYWEGKGLSIRLAYTYRSEFFVGLDRSTPQFQDDTGTLNAAINYTINDRFSISAEALNLNDPILKYYGANQDQPRAFYRNGRQFYFGVRAKL